MGVDSMSALRDYLEFKNLLDEIFFETTVLVEKDKENISNEKRKIQISKDTYKGWSVMIDDIKEIVGYETFNVEFQKMTYSRGSLLIENNGYLIILL